MDLHREIERVAYALYEKSGRAEGRHAENWFEAEKIVMARLAGEKSLAYAGEQGLSGRGVATLERPKAEKPAAKKPAAEKPSARKPSAKSRV